MSIRELFNPNNDDLYCKDLNLSGNLNMNGDINVDDLKVLSTTNSTSITTGALTVGGGCGIAKNLFVGGLINGNLSTSVITQQSIHIPNTSLDIYITVDLVKTGSLVLCNVPTFSCIIKNTGKLITDTALTYHSSSTIGHSYVPIILNSSTVISCVSISPDPFITISNSSTPEQNFTAGDTVNVFAFTLMYYTPN